MSTFNTEPSWLIQIKEVLNSMDKIHLVIAGITLIVINMAASLGVFVKYADLAAYAVSKETYTQNSNNLNARLSNIEDQMSEINKDIKIILRFYGK